ncbi:MAG: DNA polymerase I [Litorivicinaceae bacterium]|nr:DNA polymerase I [Litorivicinaceae bacterium]MDP5341424.1 DNA polymerase I [Litorivicinaceae bacterium]
MTEPLVLVDGSSYLYRAFHALPPLTTSRGQPVGAIRGVVSMLEKLATQTGARDIGVIFDAPGKTFRDAIFSEYKANRATMPDDLRAQVEPLHAIIRALGFPLLVIPGVEADDVIGTLAHQAALAGRDVLVSTGDKDLAQLVNTQITLVNTMNDSRLDESGVIEKFGVRADQIIDFLTLTGDSVDNIPGIPKCGPKTAAKWLQTYETLDNLVQHADEITGKIGEGLRAHLEQLPLSKLLVTIDRAVELEVGPGDLRRQPLDIAQLTSLYTELEMQQSLRQLGRLTSPTAQGTQSDLLEAQTPTQTSTPVSVRYETVRTDAQLASWIERCRSSGRFVLDTETTSLVARHADLVGIALSDAPGSACYIPIAHREGHQLSRASILRAIQSLLENVSLVMIGHHLKYDLTILERAGLSVSCGLDDTLLMSYVLDAATGRHDMDSLALRHLGHQTISYEDVCGKGAKQIRFDDVAIETAAQYAAEDADITYRLFQCFAERLSAVPALASIYRDLELPVMGILRSIENHGALIDPDILAQQSLDLGQRLDALEAEAIDLVGRPFNLASPKQLQAILYDELKLPVLKKTPKGQPSTNEEVLQELALDYPLPKILITHRSLSKLKGTYTDKLPLDIDPIDGRIHTSFHQAVTSTGRLSSSDPNLQNIPIRTEEGRRIRKAFIAPPSWVVLASDYSQIELRIMAHLSADRGLVQAFARGDDIHRATAGDVFGVEPMFVTDDLRRRAKAINFGLIYGMSAFGLARQLGIDRGEAQQYIDRYFERYPGVKQYMERTRAMAHDQGYVETVFGRRLMLPDIHAKQAPVRQAAERAAINAPMQGTAADIIKRAMIAVWAWLDHSDVPCRLLLQVHDELVFEVDSRAIDAARAGIRTAMESAAELSVPLVVEMGHGRSWFEAH